MSSLLFCSVINGEIQDQVQLFYIFCFPLLGIFSKVNDEVDRAVENNQQIGKY